MPSLAAPESRLETTDFTIFQVNSRSSESKTISDASGNAPRGAVFHSPSKDQGRAALYGNESKVLDFKAHNVTIVSFLVCFATLPRVRSLTNRVSKGK